MIRLFTRIAVLTTLLTACGKPSTDNYEVMWGVHTMARSANLLNLKPRQSVEVCTDASDRLAAAHDAIRKWATALGRWGHFTLNPCNSNSTVKINILPGNQVGLNYFTANPGRIFIQSNATGKFMSAIMLHEFGHSFGMCDQYSGGGGCSNHSSPRKENSEVMGATSANKQTLTPGDIEGVRKAASAIRTEAAIAWEQYLAANPPPQGSGPNTGGSTPTASEVFAAVSLNDNETLSLAISVPAGASKVALCQGSAATCQEGGSGNIQLRAIGSRNGRDLYKADSISSNQQTEVNFVASFTEQSTPKTKRFKAKKN